MLTLTPQDNAELIESACQALWSLSMEDENIEIMSGNNTISMIVEAINRHKDSPKVNYKTSKYHNLTIYYSVSSLRLS